MAPSEKSNASADEKKSSVLDSERFGSVDENALNDAHFQQERTVTGVRWFLVMASVLSAITLYSLDNTIVADLQPAIIEEFGELDKLPWVSVGTLVACVATNSIWGKIYDQLNAKWTFLVSIFLFEVGSALCGAAPTMNSLIGGRALAGVGGVGLYVGVLTLLSVNTTTHERPTYLALTGLTWGLGTVCGPIVGGAFAVSAVGWRWAFYINLLFFAVSLPVYIFLIPTFDPRPGVPYKSRLAQLDYVGTVLMIGACVSGVMAINFGGQIYPWNSGQTISCFVVSGVLFILLGFQQAYCLWTTKQNRTFPCQFVVQPVFVILFSVTAAVAATAFVAIYFVPLFFQFTRGDTAIEAGVRLLPLVCFMVVACLVNGALMAKLGYYMPWFLVGGVLALIGSALMYTVGVHTSAAKIYGYTILLGAGAGAYSQAAFAVAQAKARPSEIPVASSFISLGQLGGGTIALAIGNSVFLEQSTSGVLSVLPDASTEQIQQAVSGAGGDFLDSLDSAAREGVLQAITSAISTVYILAITGAALTVVLALFMPREKLFEAKARAETAEHDETAQQAQTHEDPEDQQKV